MEKMLSVTEYAAATGKDPGNIRRMLAEGRLEGCKIGKQWVISSDSPYPADRREKTGKYKGWRKMIHINSNKTLKKAIRGLIEDMVHIYGDTLLRIVLYGSYARGNQTEESDVDIALILREEPSPEKTVKMTNAAAERELESDKVLSVIDIQASKYDYWKNVSPFYKNIEKEGIVLWKEA